MITTHCMIRTASLDWLEAEVRYGAFGWLMSRR
jgi:hypothetical protein